MSVVGKRYTLINVCEDRRRETDGTPCVMLPPLGTAASLTTKSDRTLYGVPNNDGRDAWFLHRFNAVTRSSRRAVEQICRADAVT